jgi:endo-1,4-beta-xylanase
MLKRRRQAGQTMIFGKRRTTRLAVGVALATLGVTAIAAAAGAAPLGTTGSPLPALVALHYRWIGSAVDTTALANEPDYAKVLAHQFSSVTPENVMKWETVEPQPGIEDYSAADELVAFAEHQNMMVRGHNLVWHSQLPSWLTQGSFTNEQLADILHRHITDEVTHFRGRVYAWDVVNEPLNEDGTLRDTIWYDVLGPDYIAQALEWAHEADPNAKLYLNDYDIEWAGPKSDGMYALAQDLLARQVPLDGIGFESHLAIQDGFPGGMAQNMQRFADLGLDVAITEADVRMPLPVTPEKLAQQADYYRQLAEACLAVQRCVSFTIWGFTDRHSWVPGFFAGQGAADLYDENLVPKPAYDAVHQAFAG